MPSSFVRDGRFKLGKLIITAGLASLLLTGGSAQERASSRVLQSNAIDLGTAKAIKPPSASALQGLEARLSVAPAVEIVPGPATTSPPPTSMAEVLPALKRGKLYHVDLIAADEKIIAKQLASQPAIQVQGSSLVTLPGAFRQLAADGSELQLKPFVIPQRLAFSSASGMFEGLIKVGVHEIGGPATPKTLSAPISFEVLGSNAEPEELLVKHSGFPLGKIKVSASQVADRLTVMVASPFNPEGMPVELELAPAFSLSVTKAFDGLGLEAATVTVAATGLTKPKGRIVQLTADGPARLTKEELQLDENGRASTTLRSVGVGSTTITAQLTGFPPARAGTMASPPLTTLGATVFGALAGGLIRLMQRLRRGSERRFLIDLSVAVLVGVLVFLLYALGVNLLPFRFSVEIGAAFVFVVSALGAFYGPRLLEPSNPSST